MSASTPAHRWIGNWRHPPAACRRRRGMALGNPPPTCGLAAALAKRLRKQRHVNTSLPWLHHVWEAVAQLYLHPTYGPCQQGCEVAGRIPACLPLAGRGSTGAGAGGREPRGPPQLSPRCARAARERRASCARPPPARRRGSRRSPPGGRSRPPAWCLERIKQPPPAEAHATAAPLTPVIEALLRLSRKVRQPGVRRYGGRGDTQRGASLVPNFQGMPPAPQRGAAPDL